MAKSESRIIKPIIAFVILPLADSIPALSPPDKIHWIAPIIIIATKIIAPITKLNVMRFGINLFRNSVPPTSRMLAFNAGFVISFIFLLPNLIYKISRVKYKIKT